MTMSKGTADYCDEHGDELQVCEPIFGMFGGRRAFAGPVSTVRCFEDNSRVKEAVETPGEGRVLVVDGGGSLRCALVGDQLAILAQKNGWEGVIVYGCIRDSGDIAGIDIGVRALNTHPQKSIKKGVGDRDIAVTFGGVTFNPGEWLYADEDGVLVSGKPLC